MTSKQLELTPVQREVLERGLRYVRSAVAMELKEPSDQLTSEREERYQAIDQLEELIGTLPVRSAAAI